MLGLQREAVPFYERAVSGGLAGDELGDALIGLGSTLRVLGEHARAVEVLRDAAGRFPENGAIPVFLAMALHNVGEHSGAMELLLRGLVETSQDEAILRYKRAISFYAGRLDETEG